MKLIYLIPLLLLTFIPVYADTNFYSLVPRTAMQQQDICVSIWAFEGDKYMQRTSLRGADVTVEFQRFGGYDIDVFTGKTYRSGFFSICDFVTSHQYDKHSLYQITITVNETSKVFYFWTVQGRA